MNRRGFLGALAGLAAAALLPKIARASNLAPAPTPVPRGPMLPGVGGLRVGDQLLIHGQGGTRVATVTKLFPNGVDVESASTIAAYRVSDAIEWRGVHQSFPHSAPELGSLNRAQRRAARR